MTPPPSCWTRSAARRTLTVGAVAWGWELSLVSSKTTAILEHDFSRWSLIAYVSTSAGATARTIRKPVGRSDAIRQPRYPFAEPLWNCKQDIDPTDWPSRIARNISGGELSIASALQLMAPNPDSGLFGTPEELNKFILTDGGTLVSTPWVANKHANITRVNSNLWQLAEHMDMPPGCPTGAHHGMFDETITGMMGGRVPMRAVNQGMWSGNGTSAGCGAEIMAVLPMATAHDEVSTALLKVTVVANNQTNTTYIKATVQAQSSAQISVTDLGAAAGAEFYAVLSASEQRWSAFNERGARVHVPSVDARYLEHV